MGQNTSRLGLYLPGGGSTGLITPDEPADIDKINDNMTKLDADAGAYVCTSSTRPATPYNGKIIFETDTRKTLIYKSATTSWEPVDSQGKIVANAAARDALFASPVQGTKVFRTDTGVTETYYAAWNASTNPGGKTPAGWYVAERSTGLVPIAPPTIAVSGGSATVNTLGTIAFTDITSLSLNNVFSTNYKNYKFIIDISATTVNGHVVFRSRLAGVDLSGATDYIWGYTYVNNTSNTSSFANANGGNNIRFVDLSPANGDATSVIVDVINGYSTKPKLTYQGTGRSATPSNISAVSGSARYNAPSGQDGFTIYANSAGTFSGIIQIFGYNS